VSSLRDKSMISIDALHFSVYTFLMANGNGKPLKNILFLSMEACAGDLAYKMKQEGYAVKWFVQSKADRGLYEGFLEKVDEWEPHKDWADLIVIDDVAFGTLADRMRKEGKAVVGGSSYTDRLELDRDFGAQEMKAAGLIIPDSWEFDSFDEAIKFVEKTPDRYVVKPSGKAQNDKVLSFVGKEEDGKDVVAMLERYKRSWSGKVKRLQVQKYLSGIEVAVGGYFNGEDFVMPVCINFEHKRLFPGEIGPSTGEMGTSMFWTGPNRLYRETLEKMKPRLKEAGYVGYFDINCIATARAVYPLEVTPRFGYPTVSIQMEGIAMGWGDFFNQLAHHKNFTIKTQRGFQVGVVIALPPWPFQDLDTFRKFSEDAVIIFTRPNMEGIHLGDVKLEDGDWKLTGHDGYALVVTGSGATMEEARKEVYGRVKNIIIPNMFYRTDIGERWSQDGDLLHTWGLLA
jgi:phosphoribosylamine---glycine ligase